MPRRAITPVLQNSPGRPRIGRKAGPATMASAKAMPMLTPMMAIALVRCSSRVRSAVSASTAEAMAPKPCSPRPRMTPQMLSALAATALPAANISSPATMTFLRPMRSESRPKGIWNRAWVSP